MASGIRTDGHGSWYAYTDAETSGGVGVPGPVFEIAIPRTAFKPCRWRRNGPHEYALRMGPVTIEVRRWSGGVASLRDEWGWYAWNGFTQFLCGHHVGNGAPLAQCKADAIAAVERWRDSIR